MNTPADLNACPKAWALLPRPQTGRLHLRRVRVETVLHAFGAAIVSEVWGQSHYVPFSRLCSERNRQNLPAMVRANLAPAPSSSPRQALPLPTAPAPAAAPNGIFARVAAFFSNSVPSKG